MGHEPDGSPSEWLTIDMSATAEQLSDMPAPLSLSCLTVVHASGRSEARHPSTVVSATEPVTVGFVLSPPDTLIVRVPVTALLQASLIVYVRVMVHEQLLPVMASAESTVNSPQSVYLALMAVLLSSHSSRWFQPSSLQ